jgi:hypothetical protein
MKPSFEQALAESKARCESDLQRANDKAQALYSRLSTKAITQHERRVERIVRRAERLSPAGAAFAAANDVAACRRTLTNKMGHLKYQTNREFRELWTEAYRRLFMETGFNPKAQVRTADEVVLDVVVNSGLLGRLMEIVNGMLQDPTLFADTTVSQPTA